MSFFGNKDSSAEEKSEKNSAQQSVPEALKSSAQMQDDVKKVMEDLMKAKENSPEKQSQIAKQAEASNLPDAKSQEVGGRQ